LVPAAATHSLVEKILNCWTRLNRTDAEIVGSSTLDLYLAFIIRCERIHCRYPVLAGRPVDREIRSWANGTHSLAVDLDRHFIGEFLAQEIQSREPRIPRSGLRRSFLFGLRLRSSGRLGYRRRCYAATELHNSTERESPRYKTPRHEVCPQSSPRTNTSCKSAQRLSDGIFGSRISAHRPLLMS
jgi:hypothetical protein